MKITMIRCDNCGILMENQDRMDFASRAYVAFGPNSNLTHYCKKCAKEITIYQVVEKLAFQFEGRVTNEQSSI